MNRYLWQPLGKSISVSLSLDVIDRLTASLREESAALAGRGVEIGGLLLGRVNRAGGLTVVEIEGFDPVPCEHAIGPSYVLTASDRQELQKRIGRAKSVTGLAVVGFFRSHTRRDFCLSMEDAHLFSAHFPDPSMVFLLIDAPPVGRLTGGFCIWEQRRIRSVRPYLEFPFHCGALLTTGLAGPVALPVKSSRLARARQVLRPKHKRVAYDWLAGAAILLSLVLGSILHLDSTPARTARPATTAAISAPEPLPILAPIAAEPAPPRTIPPQAASTETSERARTVPAFEYSPPPAPRRSPEPAPLLPAPPQLPAAPPAEIQALVAAEPVLESPAPEISDPFVRVSVEAQPSRTKHNRRSDFIPPQPLRQPSPHVPPALRQLVQQPVPIDVKVYIDRSGQVQYAELLSNGTGPYRDLASLAVFTSRRWQFSPAHQGDQTVPAELVLRYLFGPDAQNR